MEPDKKKLLRDDPNPSSSANSEISKQPACAGTPSNDEMFTSAAHEMSTSNGPVASSSHVSSDPYKATTNNDTGAGSSANEPHPSSSRSQNINQGASSSRTNESSSNSALETSNEQCQRHVACVSRALASATPSVSGNRRSNENEMIDNRPIKESRKRPSSLKLNKPHFNEDGSSSDTGNDDNSLGSEDGCIYTYRGGEHLADLPSSFFSLDMGLPGDRMLIPPNYAPRPEGQLIYERDSPSSPDMDFLEMDFDPGPSCEADSGDEPSADVELDNDNELPFEDSVSLHRVISPELDNIKFGRPPLRNMMNLALIRPMSEMLPKDESDPTPSTSQSTTQEVRAESSIPITPDPGPCIAHVNARGERLIVHRTMSNCTPQTTSPKHVSSGDLVSPREVLNHEEDEQINFAYQINQGDRPAIDPVNLSSALYHLNMVKKLLNEDSVEDPEGHQPHVSQNAVVGDGDQACSSAEPEEPYAEVPRSMVWSEREACERQVTQIGTSACGATAVFNVFNAFGIPVNVESINTAVGTRLRANHAPLPRYLMSRAVAGCTAFDLVTGLYRASEGQITARFYPTYPERMVSLSHWLADWISLGAVPILTLNLQMTDDVDFPDAWHHQMVFGVSPRGVYLCNPVECVPESLLWRKLTSPSILYVRSRDVLSRFSPRTDLTPLMAVPDRRWHNYNVLGQVVHIIREWRATGWSQNGIASRHIRIPASYQAGITVAALTGSEAHRRLMHSPQLPLLRKKTGEMSPSDFSNPFDPSEK